MKTHHHIHSIITLFFCAMAFHMSAKETPAERAFTEIVEEINTTLNQAKSEAKEIQQRKQVLELDKVPTQEQLKHRAQAKRILREATNEFKEKESVEHEKKVQDAILDVTRLSSDFLENQKNEIVIGLDTVNLLSDRFSTVIQAYRKLEAVAGEMDPNSPESIQALSEAKHHAINVLSMADVLDGVGEYNGDLNRLKKTMDMQVGRLRKKENPDTEIQARLRAQRKDLEHVLAQLQLAGQHLEEQKGLITRLTLGQVADNMLLRASYLLLGSTSIDNLADGIIQATDAREDSLIEFQRQNQSHDAQGTDSGSGEYSNLEWLKNNQ